MAGAGALVLSMLCACGIGVYVITRSNSDEKDVTGCKEAVLFGEVGPGSDTISARTAAHFYRNVADAATDPTIQAALLATADAWTRVENAAAAEEANPSTDNRNAKLTALMQAQTAQHKVASVCRAAGYVPQ